MSEKIIRKTSNVLIVDDRFHDELEAALVQCGYDPDRISGTDSHKEAKEFIFETHKNAKDIRDWVHLVLAIRNDTESGEQRLIDYFNIQREPLEREGVVEEDKGERAKALVNFLTERAKQFFESLKETADREGFPFFIITERDGNRLKLIVREEEYFLDMPINPNELEKVLSKNYYKYLEEEFKKRKEKEEERKVIAEESQLIEDVPTKPTDKSISDIEVKPEKPAPTAPDDEAGQTELPDETISVAKKEIVYKGSPLTEEVPIEGADELTPDRDPEQDPEPPDQPTPDTDDDSVAKSSEQERPVYGPEPPPETPGEPERLKVATVDAESDQPEKQLDDRSEDEAVSEEVPLTEGVSIERADEPTPDSDAEQDVEDRDDEEEADYGPPLSDELTADTDAQREEEKPVYGPKLPDQQEQRVFEPEPPPEEIDPEDEEIDPEDEEYLDQGPPLPDELAAEPPIQSKPRIELTEDEISWYNNLKNMPSLMEADAENRSNNLIKDKDYAAWDIDGTVGKPFTMERFASWLHDTGKLDQLIRELPEDQQKRNLEAKKVLLDLFKQKEKGTYKGIYSKFIEDIDNKYAEMLKGLKAEDIFRLGDEWSKQDQKQNRLYSYSIPMLKLVKALGFVNTLVTGAPAETIQGFREEMPIKERCHPLELYIDENGRYTGKVKYHTGIAKVKAAVMRKMGARNNRAIIVGGDQHPDFSLFNAAVKDNGICLFFEAGRKDQDLKEEDLEAIKEKYGDEYARRQVLPVDQDLGKYGILELIIERLFAATQWKENKLILADKTRRKLEKYLLTRHTILNFIKEAA